MKPSIRLAVVVLTLGMLVACLIGSPSASTPTSVATTTLPAFVPTASMGATTTSPAPASLNIPTQPTGLTAVNNLEPSAPRGSFFDGILFDGRTYANPNIAGITFRTSWADLEPEKGKFDWTKLDTVFDSSEINGKWVELVLIPGFGTPAWALQGVQTATFSVIYGPGKGEDLLLPLPWDQTYLDRWFTFLKAVSARYQDRPSFIKIAADGPTSITGEMTLPNTPTDLCTWIQVGYTSDRIIEAWKQVFSNYALIFPHQYFSLALFPPLPIVSKTHCESGTPTGVDHAESARVSALIVAQGAGSYPRQFVVQENGLSAARDDASIGNFNVVKSYSGKVVIGYQLTTSAMMNPVAMGDPDGATALQKSLQIGLDAHAQFLEVYEPDVLNPGAQSVLASFASALAKMVH